MNWTSTKVPLWQVDCENFWQFGHPLELRDVTTEEHKQFVTAFAQRHQLTVSVEGTTVRFERERTLTPHDDGNGRMSRVPNRDGRLN